MQTAYQLVERPAEMFRPCDKPVQVAGDHCQEASVSVVSRLDKDSRLSRDQRGR
ncbi:hypothetical protein [Thalassoglobus sp.]|uniref:hypothetical protein n=1 Tax=Thalassoglobus sp. TaxID=2795869 RepID=UPI003AA94CA0